MVAWVAFFVGRYSYLIRRPSILLSGHDKWLIERARDEAIEMGASRESLTKARIVETVTVYFGDAGVEVTLMQGSGDFLQGSGPP